MSPKLELMIDYSHVSLSKSKNRVCEAIDCFEIATEVVEVSAGKFGTLTLNLCHGCAVNKFGGQES
ncbi:MAG: hypothetical protein WBL44_17760 [Nitrososphaeraceae archaeon]|jgi:hypothetical protein